MTGEQKKSTLTHVTRGLRVNFFKRGVKTSFSILHATGRHRRASVMPQRLKPTPRQLPAADGLSCKQPAPFPQRGADGQD